MWSTLSNFKHGGSMHYTEQIQWEATSSESEDEPSSGLKEILSKSEGVYQHTSIWTGTIIPLKYNALARGIDMNEPYPTIAESHASNSSTEKESFAYMAGTLEEVVKRFEEQAQIQRGQFGMIRAQWESINTLKHMLAQLLKKKKKGLKAKEKRREKTLLLGILRVKITQTLSPPNLNMKRRIIQKNLVTPG